MKHAVLKLLVAPLLLAAGMVATPAQALVAPLPRPVPSPVPPPGWTYVWVNPVYQTVTERNWVPDRTQLVAEWVETSPGHMELVYRQITIPGYWQTTTRRVLISDGHWQLVRVDAPPIVPPPIIVRNPGTVGVEGYAQIPTEDLSKFSPLSEWPK
jgi:hypothetical protein